MRKVIRFGITALVAGLLLNWTMVPAAVHAVDREGAFWIIWGLVEAALVLSSIALCRKWMGPWAR